MQALSHTGLRFSALRPNYTSTLTYPEPDGELLNQSESIIGVPERVSNLSNVHRTTVVTAASY